MGLEETRELAHSPSTLQGHGEDGHLQPGRGFSPKPNHADPPSLRIPASRSVRNKFCCFQPTQSLGGTLLQHAERTRLRHHLKHIFPVTSRLAFDQTAGHSSLTKLTHKMSHLRHLRL